MRELLLQPIGFLIQAVPVALLFFVPFEQEKLHIRGKWLYGICLGVQVVLALLFVLCLKIFLCNMRENVRDYADMITVAAMVISAVLAMCNVRDNILKKILILCISVFYGAVVLTFSSLIMGQFLPQYTYIILPYSIYNILVLTGLTAVTLPAAWWFMKRSVGEYLRMMNLRQIRRICRYVIFIMFLFCIFIFVSPSFKDAAIVKMVICNSVLNIAALYILFHEVQLVQIQEKLESRLRMFEVEYQTIENSIQEMNRFRHDLRHHLGVISSLNAEGKKKELTEYLNQYVNAYDSFEKDKICEYPLVNTILKYYMARIERENIDAHINIMLEEDLGFDFMDMTVLLGNCIENSIEANMELPAEQRKICIEMMKVKGALLILIENRCAVHKRVAGGSFVGGESFASAKKGGLHGYGMGSVSKIAEKYNGSVEYRQEEHKFTVRIVLYIQ